MEPKAPAIGDMDYHEVLAAMLAYRSGARASDVMGEIARDYSDLEIEAIAEFIGGPNPDYTLMLPTFDLNPLYP